MAQRRSKRLQPREATCPTKEPERAFPSEVAVWVWASDESQAATLVPALGTLLDFVCAGDCAEDADAVRRIVERTKGPRGRGGGA